MDFDLLFVYLIFGLACFFIGWKSREWYAISRIQQIGDDIANEMIESYKKDVIDIKVDRVDNEFFVYKREDGSYLAHGETMSKLEDILNDKFPGKKFNATPEDMKKLNTL
jgi:hypothetical protein